MIQLTTNKPLHEQYRPDTFENVVGQEKAVKRLQVVGRRGFGGKAVWLYGESGTGKTTLAYIVGKATILFLVFAGVAGQAAAAAGTAVHDAFGRDIRERGLTLVDWEGHMSNPVATFTVTPPAGAVLPVTAELSSATVRLYFDLPSQATETGPRKTLIFKDSKAQRVRAGIFPDRDGDGETHKITIRFTDSRKKRTTLELPVHVIDQDRPKRKGGFPFVLDYSQDKTGFFKEAKHRDVVKQAATDWGYFLDGSGLDETPADAEPTLIWPPEDFVNGTMTTNKKAYTGFLIYAYGIHTPGVRSGGEPSAKGGLQKHKGKDLPLKRSGGLEIEIRGNFNTVGWMVSLDPEEWWKASNLREVKNDLYSIVYHEMGHTICFNAGHPGFRKWFLMKKVDEKRLTAYQGQPVLLKHDHCPGGVDRLSCCGIFGNEFHGLMPNKRWMITKLDLLILQASGWRLRATSAFTPLELVTRKLEPVRAGRACTISLEAAGGLPAWDWAISTGELPPGLALNPFTGAISGIPKKTGTFTFAIRLRDSDERTPAVTRELILRVDPSPGKNVAPTLGSTRPGFATAPASARAPTADKLLARSLRWRNIGPANMMGRITAIEALSTDYRHVLVASASGGVFRSTNAGITWEAIFDNSEGAGSIGAVAMFEPEPDVIWVGTGEAANRNSSGWGNGLFKTTDGGKTWQHVGLANTHHIAEIALHPTDPDIAYAASPGHLWGYSGDRGLFKTTDGGVTWTKLGTGAADDEGGLPDDGQVGATEIIMDPRDPNVLYAGMYHRLRQPATMHSGGPNGGIFKSEDGGDSWRRLNNGLAEGETGMIDLSIFVANPDVIVAAYEADENIPYDDSKPPWENTPGTGIYISEDAGDSWKWILRTNTRPFYHGQVQIDPSDKNRIFSVGRSFQVTLDGGETWRGKWWGGGGDDHDFWIDLNDSSIFYTATDQGAYLTLDDGKNVLSFDNMAIGQYYKIGVDMRDPYWVIGGQQDNAIWMGPSNSRETRGILNMHNTWLGEGDGCASLVDPTDYRVAYMVNHVGFAMRLNIETRESTFITPTPETVVNFADYSDAGYSEDLTIYTIDPGEHWFGYGRPKRPLMPPHFRFNWNSPLTMSPKNPRVLYFAGNHLFKSVDRGDTWRIISPDLTNNDPDLRNPTNQGGLTRSVTGGENHFTIFTVRESPLDPALVWAGTDDGNLHVTRNGGASWTNVRDNLPGLSGEFWVNRVEPSHHDVGTIYVAIDNHRLDDMDPHIYVTRDFGATFTDITGNLPDGIGSYIVIEDTVNPKLLFVGTEYGAYASIEGGKNWFKLSSNMPNVAVRDMLIHPRDPDLVAGTHGRAIWILDDITPLRQMTTTIAESTVHAFENEVATKWVSINLGRKQTSFLFRGANPPAGAAINFWLKDAPQGNIEIQVSEFAGDRVADVRAGGRRGRGGASAPQAGINRVFWKFQFPSTAAERTAMNDRLISAIEFLEGRVSEADLKEQLGGLRKQLAGADNDRALNQVRDQLAEDFNGYAAGVSLFGPRIGAQTAAAGTYRLTITANGETSVGTITVREDPLMVEHGGR